MITPMWQGNHKSRRWNKTKQLLGLLIISGLTNGLCMSVVHADEELSDLAGRIEYAYYAADGRSLQQSLDALEHLASDNAEPDLVDSYLNYGRWKLAQLQAKSDPVLAERMADACVDSKAIKQGSKQANQATHHALIAACLEMLVELRPLRKVLYRGRRDNELAEAQQSGATIAQVQFISAWLADRKSNAVEAEATLKLALRQYDQVETATVAGDATLGHAEAAYLLGKYQSMRGDILAARNSLEQALVLAPDYREAQLLLRSLTLK